MEISNSKVICRIIETWVYTLCGLLMPILLAIIFAFFAMRMVGPKVILSIIVVTGFITTITWIFSEKIVVSKMGLKIADSRGYPIFHSHIQKICANLPMRTPRLYILPSSQLNAFAFGMGFFGRYGIAISESMYHQFDEEELLGVLGHEVSHILSCDVGLFTVLTIFMKGSQRIAAWLTLRAFRFIGFLPFIALIPLLYFLSWVIFPIAKAAVMQEREYGADTLCCKLLGSTQPMLRALQKLEKVVPDRNSNRSTFLQFFSSHPQLKRRIAWLKELLCQNR